MPREGLELKPNISRRDPTKVLLIDGVYHVWYTCRKAAGVQAGGKGATDTIPSFDWDLCDLWHATSKDGWSWKEEEKPAVARLAKPQYDWRSISSPDILIWKGKYFLYYKGSPQKGGRVGTIIRVQGVAIAEHPLGPFKTSPLNPVINSGHETCMFPFQGRPWLPLSAWTVLRRTRSSLPPTASTSR